MSAPPRGQLCRRAALAYGRECPRPDSTLGPRWNEALGLRVCDLNPLRHKLTLGRVVVNQNGSHTFTERLSETQDARTVPVPGPVMDALPEHLVVCSCRPRFLRRPERASPPKEQPGGGRSVLVGMKIAAAGLAASSVLVAGLVLASPSFASAEPTPSASPSPHRDCRAGAQVTVEESTITATGAATVTVREIPNTVVDLFAYTRPSTEYRLARSERTNADGIATFTIRPPANTRLKAAQREEDCTDPVFGTEPSVVLNVRTALTLTAERNGVRDYTFAGDSLPARPGGLIVSLYRITDSGRQVLTAQARADAQNGEWTIDRKFTGTGRFGFVVRTGQDLQNAPGVSNTRSTLIY